MSELAIHDGTLKPSELLAKLEAGFALELLPLWSLGSTELDRSRSALFFFTPPTVYNNLEVKGYYQTIGCGSAYWTTDECFIELCRTPQRWKCRDLKIEQYLDPFDLTKTELSF